MRDDDDTLAHRARIIVLCVVLTWICVGAGILAGAAL